eukprot:301237-Alexandrium_andersonii.AAC.1
MQGLARVRSARRRQRLPSMPRFAPTPLRASPGASTPATSLSCGRGAFPPPRSAPTRRPAMPCSLLTLAASFGLAPFALGWWTPSSARG